MLCQNFYFFGLLFNIILIYFFVCICVCVGVSLDVGGVEHQLPALSCLNLRVMHKQSSILYLKRTSVSAGDDNPCSGAVNLQNDSTDVWHCSIRARKNLHNTVLWQTNDTLGGKMNNEQPV